MAGRKSAYIRPEDIRDGVIRATFGGPTPNNQILALHCAWNNLLKQAQCKTCWFQEDKPHSGCNLPMCPRCAVRSRVRFIKNVTRWHWRFPEAPLSLLDYRLVSLVNSPTDFRILLDPSIRRQGQSRSGGSVNMKLVGRILTSAIAGRAKIPGYMVDDGKPRIQRGWIHRQLKVFWHDPASHVPRLRGSQPIVDTGLVSETQHLHAEDLDTDPLVPKFWRSRTHAGRQLVGALLGRFDDISTYLSDGGAAALEFIADLRRSGSHNRYIRVNKPPE